MDRSVSDVSAGDVEYIGQEKSSAIVHQAIEVSASSSPEPKESGISLRAVAAVEVRVRKLTVSLDNGKKKATGTDVEGAKSPNLILNNVSADMPAGTLTAILGASGSGKTTMLNVMANRMDGNKMKVFGTTTYNWEPKNSLIPGAYVMQQDILLPSLTVRETLQYAADLRLPNAAKQREQIVEEVILELGLKECADTRIGDSEYKGCSGGEKRRVSIGVQLLANPSVLFLDEPTTGLDATSAIQLVRTLKDLADRGRTIIMTVHQPRSEIWHLVDNTILLAKGSPLYSGPKEFAYEYFDTLGYPMPKFVNPAEFLVDLAAIDSRTMEKEQSSTRRVNSLIAAWSYRIARTGDFSAVTTPRTQRFLSQEPTKPYEASFIRQTIILTKRTFKVSHRDPLGMIGTLIEAVLMAIITGWIFYKLDGSLSGIRSRQGALYVASALQAYMITTFEVYRLSIDIQLFDRERREGVIGVAAFLLSRRLARFLTEDLPVPLLFSIIFYLMVGFRLVATQFATFFAIVFVLQFAAVNFSMLAIAVSRNYATAAFFANTVFSLQGLACGFFIQISNMPVYVRWLRWINVSYYAFGALVSNEFSDQFYECTLGGPKDEFCKEFRGSYILESLGFREHWKSVPITIVAAITLFLYFAAAMVFKLHKVRIGVSRSVSSSGVNHVLHKDKFDDDLKLKGVQRVTIDVSDFSIDIERRNIWGKTVSRTGILQPVNASFAPGKLNVIMGPSGSGKTTLLNAMANRLKNSQYERYQRGGKMMYNQAEPSAEVVKSLCSFVTQDDDALLPSLTVRETLRFAASLRLPAHMTSQEKQRKADEVLLKMGLKHCADTLIGSDMVKGISGGEKRRVTIAVQILTEPRLLLLDEPTSGLDAFTASSILSVLSALADEGRTVVLTIHQSRSDLFSQFGNIILLARGGSVIYSGDKELMLPHFSQLGYDCPVTTNPTDFVLDLITVDLQQEEREAATRNRVNSLIRSWKQHSRSVRPTSTMSIPAELGSMVRASTPFSTATPLLIRRGMLNFRRQRHLLLSRLMQPLGLGIMLAMFYAPLRFDFYSVQSRLGLVQQIVFLYFIGMLQNVAVYPFERDVAYKEMDDGAYSAEAFFVQYAANEIPIEIACVLIFSCFAGLVVDMPRNIVMVSAIVFNGFCLLSCGESVGIVFNTIFRNTGFAVNIVSLFLAVAIYMAGILSIGLPPFLKYINYVNPVRFAAASLSYYSLHDITFTCTPQQRINGDCPLATGDEALSLFNLNINPVKQIVILAALTVIYRFLSYIVLKIARSRTK